MLCNAFHALKFYFCGLSLICWMGFVPSVVAAPMADQQAAEASLEAKIQRQLEAVLGPGHSRVSVTLQRTAGAQERQRSDTHPQVVARRSERERNGAQERSGGETSWTYDQREVLTQRPAEVFQKSVAVVFDPPAPSEADGEAGGASLDVERVRALVRSIADLDESRGDQLSVQEAHFAPPLLQGLKLKKMPPWWFYALIGLVGLWLGLGLGFLWARRRLRRQPEQAPLGYAPEHTEMPNPSLSVTTSDLDTPD